MKKRRISTLLLPLLFLAVSITGSVAQSRADAGGGGDRAIARSTGRGSVTYGGRGGYDGRGSYTRYLGHRHDGHFSGSIWIGPGWGWDPFFYPYSPYYYSYPGYPYYYTPPTVVVPQEPQEYISPEDRKGDEGQYWYYCRKPEGYYPYVGRCPGGWLKVVPNTTPPGTDDEDKEE